MYRVSIDRGRREKMGQIREMKPIEERREIVKKALRIQAGLEDATIVDLAEEHGITRQGVYNYLSYVTDDPEGKLKQAEEEVEFRREVLRLIS